MDQPRRYHPLMVTLHWLVAVLVGIELYLGLFAMGDEGRAASFASSRLVLAVHMATGLAILLLVIVRFVLRLRSKKPADANAGNPFLGIVAKLVHYGLYVMLVVITVVGLVMAIQTRRLQSTFLGQQPQFGEFARGTRPDNPQFAPGGQPGQSFQPPQGGFTRPEGGFEGGGFRRGDPFQLRTIHKLGTYILLLLVGVHLLATLYHLVIRRDNLLARMWYGAA